MIDSNTAALRNASGMACQRWRRSGV